MANKIVKNSLLSVAGIAAAFVGSQATSASADEVKVQKGDTVWALAQKNNTTVDAIAAENGLKDAALIQPGQTLNIPGATDTSASASTQTTTATATTTAQTVDANGEITVQAGDTINKLAEAYNIAPATLVANNNGTDLIVVGQKLKVNGAVATKATTTQTSSTAAKSTSTKTATSASTSQKTTTTQATSTVSGSSYLAALNSARSAAGLSQVTESASLDALAQQRLQSAIANGGLPTNHFSTNGEVVALGWNSPSAVISAWINETNMATNGTPGHRMWVYNVKATSVGFASATVNGVTYVVAESNVGQY